MKTERRQKDALRQKINVRLAKRGQKVKVHSSTNLGDVFDIETGDVVQRFANLHSLAVELGVPTAASVSA